MKKAKMTFRLEEKLKFKIKAESKKAKITMSEYVNRHLKNKSIVVIDSGKEIYHELNKIGTNINQIAKKLNSNIATSNDIKTLSEISEGVTKIWLSLNSL